MRRLIKGKFRLSREQSGFTLDSGLSTIFESTDLCEQRATAANLAQSQMEIIKHSPYADCYESDNLFPCLSLPHSCEVAITAEHFYMCSECGEEVVGAPPSACTVLDDMRNATYCVSKDVRR